VLKRLYYKEGATLQVHQPQRFSDGIWRLLSALETQLGCLGGWLHVRARACACELRACMHALFTLCVH